MICPCCNAPISANIEEIDPTFLWPDEVAAMSSLQRDEQLKVNASPKTGVVEMCAILPPRAPTGDELLSLTRPFLRCILPIPVHGLRRSTINWGLWVEMTLDDIETVGALWTSPEQGKMPPFDCQLANELPGDRGVAVKCGTPLKLQLTDAKTRTKALFPKGSQETFARWQREGVSLHVANGWISMMFSGESS